MRFRTKEILILSFALVLMFGGSAWAQNGRSGVQYRYYDTGEIHLKMNFKNGELDGIYTEYDKDGSIIKQKLYREGLLAREGDEDAEFVEFIQKDIGPVGFITTIWFWLIVLVVGAIIWFVFVKIAFFDRPL